jgi:hypothetical protein
LGQRIFRSIETLERLEEARILVAYMRSLFDPWKVDALVDTFTPDFRFYDIPEFRGQETLRRFFNARAQRRDHRLGRLV